jgi:transcriptional regulator with XRE-family HTH domain
MKQMPAKRRSIKQPTDHLHKIVGKRLHKLRQAKRYTLKFVAAELNIPPTIISRIEKGIYRNFQIGRLKNLCDFYEVDPLDIVNTKEKWNVETAINNNKNSTDL